MFFDISKLYIASTQIWSEITEILKSHYLNLEQLISESNNVLGTNLFYNIIFFIFALSAIISGFFVISSINPMHSVFSLVLTFLNATILLLLLGIEFLAFLFLIIYVGAIAILFLFVVMMLNIRIIELFENTTRYIPIGLIIGIIFFIELSIIRNPENTLSAHFLNSNFISESVDNAGGPTTYIEYNVIDAQLDRDFKGNDEGKWLNVANFETISSVNGMNFKQNLLQNAYSTFSSINILTLGNLLYTEYFLFFLIASVILLIAMIGAIILTLYHEQNVKRQDIYSQISTSYSETLHEASLRPAKPLRV